MVLVPYFYVLASDFTPVWYHESNGKLMAGDRHAEALLQRLADLIVNTPPKDSRDSFTGRVPSIESFRHHRYCPEQVANTWLLANDHNTLNR
nr:MAG: hypothetical protein BECKFW1821B_GA0114236_11384 [Candidatus Kentron sp. FW]